MVSWAMRYGNPALGPELARLKDAGCTRILIAPLYPQYSAATTASAMDAVGESLRKMRWQPAIRTLPPYYDDPLHIEALRSDIARGSTSAWVMAEIASAFGAGTHSCGTWPTRRRYASGSPHDVRGGRRRRLCTEC